jgi:hypothetical protein
MDTIADLLRADPTCDDPTAIAAGASRFVSPAHSLALASFGAVARAITTPLDEPLVNVGVRAWTAQQAIREACDAARGDPLASVLGRRVRSTQRPRVDIVLDGQSIPILELKIDIELLVDAVDAIVVAGRVDSISTGTATSRASVEIAGHRLAETGDVSVDLGGVAGLGVEPGSELAAA